MTKADKRRQMTHRAKSRLMALARQPDGKGYVQGTSAPGLVRRGYIVPVAGEPRNFALTAIGWHYVRTGEQKGS